MDRIARASTGERRLVFEAAAQRMALAPVVVEKDFWVCYTLDHLYHRSGFAESMVFKGGTSLSKAFGLIERFSEDIDLILDWRLLGYGEDEPWEPRSNSHDLVTPLMAVTANCDVLEVEASDQAGLASWVANIRAAADEMATRIADMLMHMGGDQPGRSLQRALLSGKRLVARHAGVRA